MKKFNLMWLSICLLLSVFYNALACTDFQVIAKDNTVVIGRSMEFALDLKSNLMSSPREKTFTNTTPNGKPGMAWKTKYGYLFLDGLDKGFAIDGMNEAGLSVGDLYLPGETQYQTVSAGQDAQAMPYFHFADWILGNFATVDELKQALPRVIVYAQPIPNYGDVIFPIHFTVHDKTGKGLVIEFVKGKMRVYDNVGVMTNSPTYNWHLTNLRNYLNLSPYNPEPIVINGISYAATGQGSGSIGLPGDYSPPSRFVKVAFLLKNAFPANNAMDAVNLATHIMNNVDIALGTVRAKQSSGQDSNDYTQWVVFKDITNNIFYYRTYNNSTIHSVSMAQVNFAPGATQFKMPLLDNPFYLDMTQKFTGQNANK